MGEAVIKTRAPLPYYDLTGVYDFPHLYLSTTSAAMLPHSLNIPLSAKQATIVRDCADAVQATMTGFSVPRPLLFDTCVVKFSQENILNEGDTQAFVYDALKSFPDAPHVPEVYECFTCDHTGMEYLVMERVDFPTVETWVNNACSETEKESRFDTACQAVANTLRWLFDISPLVGAEIGLIEGAYTQTLREDVRARSGCARHRFFGMYRAPFRYTGAPALQRHINKAISFRPGGAQSLAVEITDEPLVMVQGDINPSNFLIDPKTLQVTIIDFGSHCIKGVASQSSG